MTVATDAFDVAVIIASCFAFAVDADTLTYFRGPSFAVELLNVPIIVVKMPTLMVKSSHSMVMVVIAAAIVVVSIGVRLIAVEGIMKSQTLDSATLPSIADSC